MLRRETKTRARTLQLLYAWEIQDHPPLARVAGGMQRLAGGRYDVGEHAETIAQIVADQRDTLDGEIEPAIQGWDYSRIGVIEKNILRLAVYEMTTGEVPVRVIIDEALRLTHWFAGPKAHLLINGVLDRLARDRHLL